MPTMQSEPTQQVNRNEVA